MRHVRSNAVAYLALFVALGGGVRRRRLRFRLFRLAGRLSRSLIGSPRRTVPLGRWPRPHSSGSRPTPDSDEGGQRDRVGALRLIADALQKDLKEGGEDEVAVLRRERKRRLEAAEAYREGGNEERAAAEDAEAELISSYLPAELSDEELAAIADEAVAESGAAGMQDMGKVMGVAMGKVGGGRTASASAPRSASG